MKNQLLALASVSLVSLALGGCVSQGKYDRAVATTQITRAELQKKDVLLNQKDALLNQKDALLDQTNADLTRERDEASRMKAEIDQLVALDQTHTGENRTRIGELQKRLGELQAAQHATEARAALYKDLTMKLRKQIDNGDLAVVVRDGRMVLQLPDDVLFDSGRTELKPGGRLTLSAVAEVIKTMQGRQFQIAGHTDNVPIHNDRFASNWELSSGRALRVVHFLIGEGAAEGMLSAAGYSDTDPISANTTPDGRHKNRRTEITLQPNIDELVKIPE